MIEKLLIRMLFDGFDSNIIEKIEQKVIRVSAKKGVKKKSRLPHSPEYILSPQIKIWRVIIPINTIILFTDFSLIMDPIMQVPHKGQFCNV